MELEKIKNCNEENMPNHYMISNKDKDKEEKYLDQNLDNMINDYNLIDIRKYLNNNNIKIIDEDDHLITDINKKDFSEKDNTSIYSSNNDNDNDNDLVMNKNYNDEYNYNPISSSKNNSSRDNNIISEPNNLYTSQKKKSNTSSSIYDNINYQYYSEQKVFNPGLVFDYSTKNSTRSLTSRHGHGNEYIEKNVESKSNNEIMDNDNNHQNNIDDINNLSSNSYCNNKGRNSLVNMVNEYCDNNSNNEDDYLVENIKDNKMTMNSFDSSQKSNKNENIKQNIIKENNIINNNYNYNDNKVEINSNSVREKTNNSEKMIFNNEEISNLLNNNKNKDKKEKEKENEECQISMNYYITSKNKNNSNSNNNNNKISSHKQNKKKNENIKIKVNNNDSKISGKNLNLNENKKLKEEKPINQNQNKNKIIENIPFQGSYIDYKKYEKYILDSNHEELLNTGNDEDIFGKCVDNIIQRSYHVYTNRQCPSCANLLSNGQSCVKCPKFHHLIKNGNNKRNKNKK